MIFENNHDIITQSCHLYIVVRGTKPFYVSPWGWVTMTMSLPATQWDQIFKRPNPTRLIQQNVFNLELACNIIVHNSILKAFDYVTELKLIYMSYIAKTQGKLKLCTFYIFLLPWDDHETKLFWNFEYSMIRIKTVIWFF